MLILPHTKLKVYLPDSILARICTIRIFEKHLKLGPVGKGYLRSIIEHMGAELVIINSPFTLIKNYWEVHKGASKIESGLYFTGSDLVLDLKDTAKKTGVPLVITHIGAFFDWRITKKIVPWIPEGARAQCRYRIFVGQPGSAFETEIVDLKGELEKSSTIFPRPRMSEGLTETLLARAYKGILKIRFQYRAKAADFFKSSLIFMIIFGIIYFDRFFKRF